MEFLFSAKNLRGLPAGATFSRGSTAWTLLPDGTLAEVAANVPRIVWLDLDGDGVRETPALRLEPARTNLLTWSEAFDNSAWIKWQSSITPNATAAPDGTSSADALVENTAFESHWAGRDLTSLSDNTTYVASVFAKARERTWLRLSFRNKANVVQHAYFNLVSGTIGTVANATARIERFPNGWYRLILVANTGTGAMTPQLTFQLATGDNQSFYTGNGTSGAYIWGAQLEAGPAATSYMRTDASTFTRSADALSLPLPASLSRPAPMTAYLRFVESGAALEAPFLADILEVGDAASPPQMEIENESAGIYRMTYRTLGGDLSSSTAPVGVATGDRVEIAAVLTAAGAARIRIAVNGGAEQAGPLGPARGLGTTPWSAQTLRLAVRNQSPLDVIDCAIALGEWTIAQMRPGPANRKTPKIVAGGLTWVWPGPPDNPRPRTMPVLQFAEAASGVRDAWVSRTDEILSVTARFVPRDTRGGVTGWATPGTGVREVLAALMRFGGEYYPDKDAPLFHRVYLTNNPLEGEIRERGGSHYTVELELRDRDGIPFSEY